MLTLRIPVVFQKQNDKISRGEISGPGTHYLHLDTLGLVNGCVEDMVQSEAYSLMSWNNTYGIHAVNETTKHRQMWELYRPDGILDRVSKCDRLSKALEEPGKTAIDSSYVEDYCRNASSFASDILIQPYMAGRKYGWFDITHSAADAFPSNYHLGWLNEHWVQKALGVSVNYTWSSEPVAKNFVRHGDMPRGGYLDDLADLLDHGVKVHLMYGDRDFACNWIGGEAASLAIPHRYQREFARAGYTPLTVARPDEPPFVPYGLTRQHGNLSFTRVFQAGHMVPSYQPEASLRIFERALFNKDIATGAVDLTATGGWASADPASKVFSSEGTRDTWWKKNEVLPGPERKCYILQRMTCSEEDVEALRNGTAIIKDYVIVGIKGAEESATGEVYQESKVFAEGNELEAVLEIDEL